MPGKSSNDGRLEDARLVVATYLCIVPQLWRINQEYPEIYANGYTQHRNAK